MTIDERLDLLIMESHWSLMDREHFDAIQAEFDRLRKENEELKGEAMKGVDGDSHEVTPQGEALIDLLFEKVSRLQKENEELKAGLIK